MRDKLAYIAVALIFLSAPATASVVLTDDFNGDFVQTWAWDNGGGDAQAVIDGDELRLYSPYAYGSNSIGGYVAATYGLDAYVSARVNCSGAVTGNDQGLLARLQGGNEFYGLNYDPFLNKLQLIYNHGSSFTDLDGLTLSQGAHGTLGQEVELRLQIFTVGDVVRLVGQAWDPTGTALLGNVQSIVDGVTSYDDVIVPVLGAGVSGVYAALNANEYMETGGLSPLDARMDDFVASGDCSLGDANLDGIVDETDFNILVLNWGVGDSWAEADFNFDGTVDEADLASITENWGGSGPAPTGVPEPMTLSLLGAGAVALCRRRRK
jgi:hypothetical protein